MKIFQIIIILLLIFSAVIYAEDKMRLAILDLQPNNVSDSTAKMVSDLLRTELFNTGLFRVIERGEMDNILKEQEFQMSGCTDTECAVQIGKLLSARKMLVGTIGKLGDKYIINARIVDVEKGEMEFGDNAKADSEGDLDIAVKEFANKLANKIMGKSKVKTYKNKLETEDIKIKTPSESKSEIKYFKKQPTQKKYIYPYRTSGIISLIISTGCGIGGYYFETQVAKNYSDAKKAYEEYQTATSDLDNKWNNYNEKYDLSKKQSSIRNVLYIISGIGLTYGIITTFLIRKPISENISISIFSNQIKFAFKY